MQLSDEAISEFREIYQAEYGELLSVEEAREIASRLLHLCEVLSRPLPSELAALARQDQIAMLDGEGDGPDDPPKPDAPHNPTAQAHTP